MEINKDKRIRPLTISFLENGNVYFEDEYGVHIYETLENAVSYAQDYIVRHKSLQEWWSKETSSEATVIDSRVVGYDWDEVFAIAGEGSGSNAPDIRGALPTGKYNTSQFTRKDIEEIYGVEEGENDSYDWIVYGKLYDGRYFCIEAGCDYTGWDCQSGGVATIGNSKEEIERFGLADSARQRFGIASYETPESN